MALHRVSRRGFLLTSGALVAWTHMPRFAAAAGGRDPRFVFVNLRGALDGLAAVAPVGDPAHERARGGLSIPASGEGAGIPLDGFFMLNPNMKTLAELYRAKQALVVHAVASPYRDRSHFEGQDVLESGLGGVGRAESGWLNRALGAVPKGEPIASREALAVGPQVPLVMRGKAPVTTWMPVGFPAAAEDTRDRLLALYAHADPDLAARFAEALRLDRDTGGEAAVPKAVKATGGGKMRSAAEFREAGVAAGRLLKRPDGPRIGSMSFLGWDTHADEKPLDGTLARLLQALDAAVAGLKSELDPVWQDTVIVVSTEFGRTVAMNGTRGTDHGTGTVTFLVGGAVKGGRVVADWPGLGTAALHEGRDLKPTTDLRAVYKGVLRDHLGIDARVLGETVFPGSAAVKPIEGLVG